MTERDIEKEYETMMHEDMPALWDQICEKLDAQEVKEVSMQRNIKEKLKHLWKKRGFKAAAGICALVLCMTAAYGAGGGFNGLKLEGSSASYTASAEAYSTAEDADAGYGIEEYASENGAMAGGMTMDAASGNTLSGGTSDNSPMSAAGSGTTEGTTEGTQTASDGTRKLIRTIRLDMETKEYDTLISALQAKVTALGGYIEYAYTGGNSYNTTGNRNASYTVRMPQDKTDEFLTYAGENANILSQQESVSDITLSYVDTESHVIALETEQTRLLELLEQAESVENLLAIETQLSDVRYELQFYQSQLRSYDNQVDYDTISCYVQEVKEETPVQEEGILGQMRQGLENSLKHITQGTKNITIWFVASIPYFIIIAVLAVIAVFIIKRIRRKKKS